MNLLSEKLKRLSKQTEQECGLLVDDSEVHSLKSLYVERDVEAAIVESLSSSSACTVLEGDAGSGKTSLLWHVHRRLEEEGRLSLLLRADTLAAVSPEDLRAALDGLRSTGERPVLLIDTADVVLATAAGRESLLSGIDAATSLGCAVLTASRPEESRRFLADYTKLKTPTEYSEREFLQVVETHTRYFYRDAPLRSLEQRLAQVRGLATQGRPVAQLATRPLFLRMLFSLYAPHEIPSDINIANLYAAYWQRRVQTDWRAGRPEPEATAIDCSSGAQALAAAMLQEGTIRIGMERLKETESARGVDPREIDQLITRGVLRRLSSTLGSDAVEFFHQTFFEHAAGRALVADHGASGIDLLGERLAAHPNDSFRLPIFEHVLVLSQTSSHDVRTRGEHWIEQVLRQGPAHLGRPAIAAYAQLPAISDSLAESFHHALTDRRLAAPYIAATAASPAERWPEVWSNFKRLWVAEAELSDARKPWSSRRAILRQLPRLARMTPRSPEDVSLFLRDQAVVETIEVDVVAELIPILRLVGSDGGSAALETLQALYRRAATDFASHERTLTGSGMALAEHPQASLELLRELDQRLSQSTLEITRRARGVVTALLWRREQIVVLDRLDELSRGAAEALPALASWLDGRNEADWLRVWSYFATEVPEADKGDWVRHLWDRFGIHPFDRGDFLPQRYRQFVVDQTVAAAATGMTAASAICRYSRNFDLRVGVAQRLFGGERARPTAAEFRAEGVPGFLLAPSILVRIDTASQVIRGVASLAREVLQRFLEDAGPLMTMAPDSVGEVAPFLIAQGAFARVEQAIEKSGVRLGPLPEAAARRLATDILSDLKSETVARRQTAARWAPPATDQGLGVALPYAEFESAWAREADAETACWISIALCDLARSRHEVDSALRFAAEAATGPAEYSRDRALVAWLDLVVAQRRTECLSSALDLASKPKIILKRLRDLAWRIPRIMHMDREAAYALVYGLLTLPALQGRTTVLESFRRVARRPLLEWSEQADPGRIDELLDAVGRVDPLVGRLILELAYIPAHAERVRPRILRLSFAAEASDDLKQQIADLFASRRAASENEQWHLPAAVRQPEVTRSSEALVAIINAARAMEAQPEPFRALSEEVLRNVLLPALSGAFEGAASAESRNYGGKTDILVTLRSGDRFIAECKIWRGNASAAKAVDQLLGYVGPRDDAVALVIFSKTHPSRLIESAVDGVVRSRSDFVRPLRRHRLGCLRYALRHPRDAGRHLELSIFACDLRRTDAESEPGAGPPPGK